MERAEQRLIILIPLTIFLIFLVLYFNFQSIPRCLLVLLSVPFSLIDAIVYLQFLHYELSVAVWVGFIPLSGVAAETGIIMIIFLDDACTRRQQEHRLQSLADLLFC